VPAPQLSSARESALFQDDVPVSCTKPYLDGARESPAMFRYYALRKRVLGSRRFTSTNLRAHRAERGKHTTFDEAIELCLGALKPLGDEYCHVLAAA